MTVKDAAERLGVSRVALSNLLNGRASLSQQMALRLKTAFGADSNELFRIQAEAESARRREEERTIAVRTYVPSLLTIKASQIDLWADEAEEARNRLPVLVRRLIRSTGRDLSEVDFPAYGEGQRPGWDGRVEAGAATPWIPEGASGWELSTSSRPARKAESDFRTRLALPAEERAETTFVFVSSRNWPEKSRWAEKRRAEGHWRDVKALDASDLEQWLEESIEGQVWLAEQLRLPSTEDCMTLDRAWARWAEAATPPLTDAMFGPAVRAHRGEFVSWLRQPEPEGPFVVAADSTDEALAFLVCLFGDEKIESKVGDRAVVVNAAQRLRSLAPATSSFIPIVLDEKTERELVHWRRHCIAIRPRNTVDRKPDIELGLLGHETFEKSLTAMGFARTEVGRLARESGRSPTVLRRRLSENDAVRTPRWAEDPEAARKLVPMALVGVWHAGSKADREALSTLAARPFREVDQDLQGLLAWNDCPVWSAGEYRGVASKIDALFAVARHMAREDLDEFLLLAERVLSEIDPALDLPLDERWAAALHDKLRDHSDAIRTGICETMVLLAVHGNGLFQERLGIEVEARVSDLVRRLLAPGGAEAPLTVETLMSYDRELPRLAEAAPNVFLQLLEKDLRENDSALHELLKPAPPGPFADCPRTGLLWALECLAWNQLYLPRVVLILGRLSETAIDDNWTNKPINSLEAIFRSWMPQTAVPLDARSSALELLCRRVPEVGWHVCMKQLRWGSRFGDYSARPRWRGDAGDAGEPVPVGERLKFERRTLEQVLEWPQPRDAEKLGDLVDLLSLMSEEDQGRVWVLVEGWLEGQPGNSQRTALRDRLRQFGYKSSRPALEVEPALKERVKNLYERLAPNDPTSRHAWLFSEHWIHQLPEDDDDAMDFSGREERVAKRRDETMSEIWTDQGLEGALSLLPSSNAAETVGAFAWRCAVDRRERAEVIRVCLARDFPAELELEESQVDGFLGGFLGQADQDARVELIAGLADELALEEVARLLLCGPFRPETWRLVSQQSDDIQEKYWREVWPYPLVRVPTDDLTHLMDRLLAAGRPRAALHAVHLDWDAVETSRLRRLLNGIVVGPERDRNIQISGYHLCRAIESLSKRSGVTADEMAEYEFVFFEQLEYDDYGVPNLERRVAEDPDYFVWLVALAFKRNDGREDPEGWPVPDSRNRVHTGQLALSVLERVARIPGAKAGGSELDGKALQSWVSETRRQGRLFGRADMVDDRIGQLLSKEARDSSSSWPSRQVCEVMEAVATEALGTGFHVGVLNSRGAVWRGEGGGQERELAARYRAWALPLAFEFPFVNRVLEGVSESYDRDATYWESEAARRQRMEL
jgi:plasmid maintenance system antidote protein VapI